MASTALSLRAQCGEPSFGASIGTGDDTVLPMQSLGFAFPFGAATYTNIHVSTNGFVYLSNAGTPAAGGALCCAGSTTELVAGSPKIAPFWSDLVVVAGVGNVKFNALPGRAVVTWENAVEYPYAAATSQLFTFQMQLLATGEIYFTYDGRCTIVTAGDFLVGMSEGGGAAVPAASDFSTVGASTTTTNFELFNNTGLNLDLAGQSVLFIGSGGGYTWVPQACPSGSITPYGAGCYSLSDSLYQFTAAPAASSAALSNTGISLIPTGPSYLAISGGTFVAPTGAATALVLTDDSEVATPPLSVPFPYPGGSASTLTVCSNCFVSVATGNGTPYAPNIATMLGNTQTAWYAWHDFNPGAAGSGQVKFEEVGGIAYITWDGVYNYGGTTAADASTIQFQFDTATGIVNIVHGTVSSNPHTGFVTGEPHLVGYSPAGPSVDSGSTTFATGLPAQIASVNMLPLALASTTPAAGGVMTLTTSNIPEYAPGSGVYIALNVIGLTQIPAPGVDLGILGAPGCVALSSLDATQAMVGAGASQQVTFALPGNVAGLQFYSQSAALVVPNSLPNGQNAFGLTTSNALAFTVGAW